MNDSAKKEFENFNFTFDDDILLSHGDDFTEVPSEEPRVSPYQPASNIFHLMVFNTKMSLHYSSYCLLQMCKTLYGWLLGEVNY